MAGVPLLSVARTRDGIWSVNERGPDRVAIAYFPTEWGAMKHAVRVARAKRRCRVAVLAPDGAVRLSRDYDTPDPSASGVEVP